jgi:Arc/MetJ-type ribon-helix-helix transcriptional regulator
MREVLSISLPSQTMATIKQKTQKRGFNSVSEYIKHLLALDEDLISESELLKSVRLARAEYKKDKAIKANSIAELL